MTTIVTRQWKSTPLTWVEMDANLTNLNTDKLETSTAAATYFTIADAASKLETSTAAATYFTIADAASKLDKTSNTGAALMPAGTTAERPVNPQYGATRANSTLNQQEWWNGTAWVPMGGGATGQLAGFRNLLINGNFAINQRAVSGTVTLGAGVYGHDRWKAGASGCTYTFATVNNVTTLTITAGSLQQVIEGANLQIGTHILSWVGTAQGKIGAGAYSASGVTGTVIGGTNLTIEFNTGTLSLPQFEPGSIPTPFDHRPIGAELALCQWYYRTSYIGVVPGTATTAGAITGGTYYNTSSPAVGVGCIKIDFTNNMRAAPTVTIYSPSTGTVGNVFDNTDRAGTVTNPTQKGFYVTYAGNGGFVARTHYTSTSEL